MAVRGLGPYAIFDDFLGRDCVDQLLAYASENQEGFRPSGLHGSVVDLQVRASLRASVKPFKPLLKRSVGAVLSRVFADFGMPPFEPTRWEMELVAHGDRAFYQRHIDLTVGAVPENRRRRLSCVYYFYRLPRMFTGGEFRLHAVHGSSDSSSDESSPLTQAKASFIDLEPRCDRLLMFPSWLPHEVRPVSCGGQSFLDSRFAINIWLHR